MKQAFYNLFNSMNEDSCFDSCLRLCAIVLLLGILLEYFFAKTIDIDALNDTMSSMATMIGVI